MKKHVLLTGATGLVGRYLIRDLLLSGHRLAVLVRSSKKETARQRVEKILQYWERELGQTLPRPVCLQGDIGKEGFGLNAVEQRWVAEHCDRLLHNAASLTFDGDDRNAEPWITNVGGTENMLQFCRELGIRDLHYVSTAYVSGCRQGLVMENDLDLGQDFRNSYEQSKLEAEKAVRAADFFDHLTVYRPAVIAGDSKTGYTSTYHGLYMYLKLMAVMVRNLQPDASGFRRVPMRMNVDGDEPRNIVAVDWVSAVISHIVSTPEAHDNTYHLAPDQPITTRQIIDFTGTYLNSAGVEYVGRETFDDSSNNDFEQSIYENTTMYDSYNATDPQFDTTNLRKAAPHLPCPPIDEEMIHLFMQFGDDDRWGKRREPNLVVEHWADDLLAQLADEESVLSAQDGSSSIIAFDIQGPGGGQWYTRLTDQCATEMIPGLPDVEVPVLRIEAAEFAKWFGRPDTDRHEMLAQFIYDGEPTGNLRLAAQLADILATRSASMTADKASHADATVTGETIDS